MALSLRGIKPRYQIFKEKRFAFFYVLAIIFLGVSLFANYYASLYAAERASSSVTDIILSNIRAFDVDGMFVYGPVVMWVCVALLLLMYPNKVPFTLKSIALFIVIRSVFVSLTHIGPFPSNIPLDFGSSFFSSFSSGDDLFFSAHTGLPFLLALIYWESKLLRTVLVTCSLFFGVIVLLGHFHYSIDVLGAFFITYTIYHIALKVFPKDKEFFEKHIIYD